MTFTAPKAADLFGDTTPVEAASRMEEFTAELGKSLSNASSVPGQAPAADPMAQLELLASSKSLTAEASAGLQNALAAQRMAMQDIQKDITLTSPLSTAFAAFDLEAPAKMLTPRPTPLRNRIPRKNQAEFFEYARALPEYQFHCVGNQADNFKYYWEPLMQNKPDNLTWWNERSDVDSFYSAMDLFLFTSKGNNNAAYVAVEETYGDISYNGHAKKGEE